MTTIEAIQTLNATIGQWRKALQEGLSMDHETTALLLSDLESLAKPLNVLTDWLSDQKGNP